MHSHFICSFKNLGENMEVKRIIKLNDTLGKNEDKVALKVTNLRVAC